MKSLLDMVSAADGSISTMRVVVFLVVAAILFNWCYLTVHTGQKQPLDWTEVAAIVGVLGAKVAQRPFESKPTPQPPNTPTP